MIKPLLFIACLACMSQLVYGGGPGGKPKTTTESENFL